MTPHKRQPLQVLYGKGTQIAAQREDGSGVTCSARHFKEVPFKSMEDASPIESNKPRDDDNQAQAEVAEGGVKRQQGAPLMKEPFDQWAWPKPLG